MGLGKVLGAMVGAGLGLLTHTLWVCAVLGALGFVLGLRVDLQNAELIERGRVDDDDGVLEPPRRPLPRRDEVDEVELRVDLLVALAHVDGEVTREEIRAIRKLFESEPYRERLSAPDLAERLKRAIARPVSLGTAARMVKGVVPFAERVSFLDALYELAASDGPLCEAEQVALTRVGKILEISDEEARTVAEGYMPATPPPEPASEALIGRYRTLGLSSSATDAEVKKAYRALAREHHPDRVAHLGKKAVEKASARFREIDEAYEAIRASRGA